MALLTAFLVAGMALAHLFSYKLLFLQGIPRSPWLSMAGGISVAYVFLHILPELNASQGHIEETGGLTGGGSVRWMGGGSRNRGPRGRDRGALRLPGGGVSSSTS